MEKPKSSMDFKNTCKAEIGISHQATLSMDISNHVTLPMSVSSKKYITWNAAVENYELQI